MLTGDDAVRRALIGENKHSKTQPLLPVSAQRGMADLQPLCLHLKQALGHQRSNSTL